MAFEKEATLRPGNRSVLKRLDYLQRGGCLGNEIIDYCFKQFRNPLLINPKQT